MGINLERGWVEYSSTTSVKSRLFKKVIKLTRSFIKDKNIEQTRELWDSYAKKLKFPENMQTKRQSIADVDCEWIVPKDCKGKKLIIYLHGGGYVLGSLETAKGFAVLLAEYTSEKVLSVGYRLAPENPFPAALEDSLSVFHELINQGFNPEDIILVGDSAGGGLSLATVLALKDIDEPLPGAVVCLSPWTDLAATGESLKTNLKLDPVFGRGTGVIKAEFYADEENLIHPFVSPLYGDFENFPPLLIHVGTDEVILDDSLRLAEKAREAVSKFQ